MSFVLLLIIVGIVIQQKEQIQNKELLRLQLTNDLNRDIRVVEIVKTQAGLCSDELFEIAGHEK